MVSSGELSDWEDVQYPNNGQAPSSPSADEQPINLKLAIEESFDDDGSPVFPPNEHENLPVESETQSSSSSSELPLSDSEMDPPQEQKVEPDSKLSIKMSEVKARICTMGRRMSLVASCFQSCWRPSVIPAAAFAIVIFACFRILKWRNRVLLLMREKDQRISQLLNQIAYMNEILSARRRVPVLRIN